MYSKNKEDKLTMHAFPILAHLPIEHGILVAREHLRLGRHLLLPACDCAHGGARPGEGRVDDGHDSIDAPEAVAMPVFLCWRETPRDFPGKRLKVRIRE